jgi:hypothetical protein
MKKISLMKTLTAAFVAMVCLFLAGCGEKIESKWTKQALVIDGKAEDEEFPYEYWFKDERVALSVMNDGEYIYFLVSAGSRALARMLSDQGVVLWFDPGGEKQKAYGVKLVEGKDTITVMKGKDTSTVPASGKQGPAFAVLNEEGAYNYEIRVPRSAVAAKPGEKIGLGLEFTTMQVKAKKKHRSQMHEGGRGGMGGMGGYGAGRQPMGRPGAGPAPDQGGEKPKIETKLEDKEIWLQLILAEKED